MPPPRGSALAWRAPGDPRRRAGWLAGALYLVAAVEVAVRTAFLPASAPRGVLLGTAVALWAGGTVMIVLPWQRWPHAATVLPVLWAWFAFAAAGGAVAGQLHHFLPLYAVAFLYVGLTQRGGASAALAVPALLAAGIAVTGAQPVTTLPDLVAAIGVGAALGELVAWFRRRQERTTAGLEQVLDVAGDLLVCDDVPAVLDRITSRTRSLLRADGAVLYLADPDRPSYYVSQALSLRASDDPAYAHLRHPLVLEVDAEPTGIGTAVREGRAVFVREARGDPYVAARYLRAVTVGSALYVPMLGQRGPLGGIAVWWRREQADVDRVAARVVDLLGRQAAPVLERISALARLEEQATTDPLTGLSNRRAFLAALEGLPESGAVALIDLDHFKQLNDRFGHAAGDQALIAFAGLLSDELRAADCAARYGGRSSRWR